MSTNKTYDLHVLGTGSAMSNTRNNTSLALETANKLVLIDCGFTTPRVLREKNYTNKITDVLITHTHADHIGGLEVFAFERYFSNTKKPNIHLASKQFQKLLWEQGLSAGMSKTSNSRGEPLSMKLESYFVAHNGTKVDIAGLPPITYIPTKHIPGKECYAIQIGKDIYYSGDTTQLPPNTARIIIQDCQNTKRSSTDIHINYDKLKNSLPKHIRAKSYLIHIDDTFNQEVQQDGFAEVLQDGDAFRINEEIIYRRKQDTTQIRADNHE